MSILARTGLALCGLALAAPLVARADPPSSTTPSEAPTKHVHRKRLLGKPRLCSKCEWEALRAKGIDIPPPPFEAPHGVVLEARGTKMRNAGACEVCNGALALTGPASSGLAEAPGRAVVGGPAPGYAAVGAPIVEPAPIDVVQPRRSPVVAGRGAPTDRSVMQTSIAAPDPMGDPAPSRTHVIGPVVRIAARSVGLTAIGRERREERERRRGQTHAALSYGEKSKEVNELSSSIVYSRRMARQAPVAPK